MTAVDDILARLPQVPDSLDMESSWLPVDLADILSGTHAPLLPEVLRPSGGSLGLFYLGRINGLHGDSGIGKSWLALLAVAQVLTAGRRAVIIDYEANAAEMVSRLRALGCDDDAIGNRLHYIQPSEPTSDLSVDMVIDLVTPDTDVVVIDSLGEAFGLDGIDENSDADVAPWLRAVARAIADSGPAVVVVDHSTKTAKTALHPSGSKRKRAAVTGASYLVESKKPPTRTQPGTLTVTCAKDRHGTYPRGQVAAVADIVPNPDGTITFDLHRPVHADREQAADASVRRAAEEAVEIAKTSGQAMSKKNIETRMLVKVGNSTKRRGIDLAVELHSLAVEAGPRGAKLHSFRRDLPKDDS